MTSGPGCGEFQHIGFRHFAGLDPRSHVAPQARDRALGSEWNTWCDAVARGHPIQSCHTFWQLRSGNKHAPAVRFDSNHSQQGLDVDVSRGASADSAGVTTQYSATPAAFLVIGESQAHQTTMPVENRNTIAIANAAITKATAASARSSLARGVMCTSGRGSSCVQCHSRREKPPQISLSSRTGFLPKRAVNFSPAFARRYSARTLGFICITRPACLSGAATATPRASGKFRFSCFAPSSTATKASRSWQRSWMDARRNGGSIGSTPHSSARKFLKSQSGSEA